MSDPAVIKLGGSNASSAQLPHWLDAIERCAGHAILDLLAEGFHPRHMLLHQVADHGFLLRRERRVELQPCVAHLMAKRGTLLLHAIGDRRDRREIGLGFRELG